MTDGAIIWSQNENIRRNTKILKSKTKKKIVLLPWRRLKRMLLLSGSFPFPLIYIPHCARKHLARLSTRNRWRKVLLLRFTIEIKQHSLPTKNSRENPIFIFSGIFFPFSSFLTLFMFNIGNVISKNPVFPEHTSCITHICIYKFHRKTFEK